MLNLRNCLIDQKLVRVREFPSFISQEAEGGGGGGGYLLVGSLPGSGWWERAGTPHNLHLLLLLLSVSKPAG